MNADMQARIARYSKKIKTLPPHQVVAEVAQGKDLASQAVVLLSGTDIADNSCRLKLVEAGLIRTVLHLLSRCEDEKFEPVLQETNGDLALPSVWINLLLNTIANDNLPANVLLKTRLEIARGMGPLVRCMTNDIQREFFGDPKFWHAAAFYFIALLQNLVLSPETVPVMQQQYDHSRIQHFLIRSMFWQTHRPDIVQEAESPQFRRFILPDSLANIQDGAGEALQEFCDVEQTEAVKKIGASIHFTEEGKKRLQAIASTPIVNPAYTPTPTPSSHSKVTFLTGLMDLIETGGAEGRETRFFILQQLIYAHCAEKRTVTGMVQLLGTDKTGCVKSSDQARDAMKTLYNLLIPDTNNGFGPKPSDDRFAIAIKAGLFELCLQLLVRFGQPNSATDMLEIMSYLLNGASAVALLKKCSRAVTERKVEIQEAIRTTTATGKMRGKSLELVEIVRSVVRINKGKPGDSESAETQVFCRCCLKSLKSAEVKQCAKCHRGK
jgi:hypothetical protein